MFALGSSVGDDVKWKSAVERALGTWESVSEWADYISFLSRVQKAIRNKHNCDGSQLPLAPEISEMLARCLEPSLPAGVHLMCLDVYDTVFTIIGPQRLTETVNIWLPGLLPVVSWAAFNVKPTVVQILQKHVASILSSSETELRELYRPLLLALLPSIEEEAADCFTEICQFLATLKTKSPDDTLFWRCFYLCILSSSECRLGALTFIQRNKPNISESGIFVRAVCSGLGDSNVLVQRGFLDVLIRYIPLDNPIVQENKGDLSTVLLSACKTILRKDMSLNRRLWLWLMGPEPDAAESSKITRLEYFRKNAGDTFKEVLLSQLKESPAATYSIARGLMDRWEIGSTVAPALFVPVLSQAQSAGTVDPDSGAVHFFDNVESNVVWGLSLPLLDSQPDLVLFMVQNFNIKDQEMLKLYIPLTLLWILASGELSPTLKNIAMALLSVLPNQELPSAPQDGHGYDSATLRQEIASFFDKSLDASFNGEEGPDLPFSAKTISWYLLKLGSDLVLSGNSARVLNHMLRLLPSTPGLVAEVPQIDQIAAKLGAASSGTTSLDDIELFTHIVERVSPIQVRQYVKQLVESIANTLSNDGYRQVESIQALWRVHHAVGKAVVPSALSAVLADPERSASDKAKIFSSIWIHSLDQVESSEVLTKPLLLILDLAEEDPSTFWAYLQLSVVRTGSAAKLVKMLVDKLEIEIRGDSLVFGYVLDRFSVVLRNKEVKSSYMARYSVTVCSQFIAWLEKGLLPSTAFSAALELIQMTILDSRIKDGKLWLHRFLEVLIQPYLNSEAVPDTVPVCLMKFVTAAIPLVDDQDGIHSFVESCVGHIDTEVSFDAFESMLYAYLESDRFVAEVLLKRIVARLAELDRPLLDSNPSELGYASAILRLLSFMEKIIAAGLDATNIQSQQPSGISSAFSGFQVESPADRARAEESQAAIRRCVELCVSQCCTYWIFLYKATPAKTAQSSSEYSTALYTMGRLKTRLRKLLSLCYTAYSEETLQGIAAGVPNPKMAVRMIHMFEGTQYKSTLEMLLKLAAEDHAIFNIATAYVVSLEIDVLGDVWPTVQSFLFNVPLTWEGLPQFVVFQLTTRFEHLRLNNKKKVSRDYSDSYARIVVTSDASDRETLEAAVPQFPVVFLEQDKQASMLSKVLGSSFRAPGDAGVGSKLLSAITETFPVAGTSPARVWVRFIGEFLFETRTEEVLIPLTLGQSLEFIPVVKAWVVTEKDRVKEFIAKLGTYGSSTGVLFGWSGTRELVNTNLRRLAYLLVCAPPPIMAVNWAQLINQLSSLWAQHAPAICLLLRACVLGSPSSTILTFMSFRLQSVFRDVLKKPLPLQDDDAALLLEASKLLDLTLALSPEQFQFYEWLFVTDNGDAVANAASEKTADGRRAGGIVDKLRESNIVPEPPAVEKMSGEDAVPIYGGKRRTLLPMRASFADLPSFFEQASLATYEEVKEMTSPDVPYCQKWLLADLFKSS